MSLRRNERVKLLSFCCVEVIGSKWWCIELVPGHKRSVEVGRVRGLVSGW